jgi:hypothetical protein
MYERLYVREVRHLQSRGSGTGLPDTLHNPNSIIGARWTSLLAPDSVAAIGNGYL